MSSGIAGSPDREARMPAGYCRAMPNRAAAEPLEPQFKGWLPLAARSVEVDIDAIARLAQARRRLIARQQLRATVRRLQRNAPQRAAAIILQQNMGRLGDVEQTAFQLQATLFCHAFEHGIAIHVLDLVR